MLCTSQSVIHFEAASGSGTYHRKRSEKTAQIKLNGLILPILVVLVQLVLFLGYTHPAHAQKKKTETDGLFVTVSTPITDKVVNLIEHKIKEAVTRQKRTIKTVVFDFNPDGEKASTSDPYICLKLRKFIKDLSLGGIEGMPGDIMTVAFVHGEVSRHTVLPVLACNQLIMSEGSWLGPIAADKEIIPGDVKNAYTELAEPKHATPLLQQMFKGQVSTREAQKIKLCNEVYETREQVAEALDLPKRSLKENWLAGRVPLVAHVPLQGTVNKDKLSSLERRINSAILDGKNLIVLELDCEGGDIEDGARFQEFLKTRQDQDGFPLTIIAYVPPNRALGAATFLTLGCNEIVMGEKSHLGDFSYLEQNDPERLAIQGEIIAKQAKEQHYSPLLFQATLDPNLVVYDVVSKKTGDHRLMLKKDYEKEMHLWDLAGELKKNNGNLVKIDTKLAKNWDVALHTDVNSMSELYLRYNVDSSQVKVYRDDMLDRIAEFFRHPVVKLFLLLIGITGLILELKLPGFGLPGVVAAICFVLFFWSHSFVNQFTMLAVLLFVLGIVLVGVELFILPGFGITGISGILLLVTSLILVTVEKMPVTPQDWQNLGWSLGSFCLSFIGAIGLAIAIVSFLPQIPYANRLMLVPPDEQDDHDALVNGTAESFAALLGAIGMAETPLRPAGKARFGDDYLDVVSQGDYIVPGSRVQVIEIEGNRIVVKQV